MAIKFLIPILLMISSTAHAGWVGDWYKGTYEQYIAPEQQQMIQQDGLSQCEQKLRYYQNKVNEDPKSDYFQYKFEKWEEKCNR